MVKKCEIQGGVQEMAVMVLHVGMSIQITGVSWY